MEYIKIQKLQFNNMQIDISLNKQEIFAVYSRNEEIVNDFLLVLNGINPNNGSCLYLNKDIFDNEDFFKQRIYINFKESYLKTINAEFIEESLMNRFNLSFNKEVFNTYVQEMGIRLETTVKANYTFTDKGNTMVNFAFLKALNIPFITINNPTIYLKKAKIIETVTNSLVDKRKYESIILGLDRIKNFKEKLERVLVFTDYQTYVIVNPQKDSFLLIEDNIHLRDKIFRTKKMGLVICLNNYTKEELKRFNHFKLKYQKLSFYEIEDYFGDDNEK
ncbi:MAG TPA: hypothetical protein PLQ99_03835 [Bacilli bacterium]|jgi:predicted component of type VI protein secretion system|nr:hypothetical protein [Bacilli bacterium]